MSPLDPTMNNRYIPRTPGPAPAPAPDLAEVVTLESTPEPAPSTPVLQVPTTVNVPIAAWEPPAVVKLTTQMTVEHRQLLHRLERQTGTSLWKLIGHAIEETYGSKH
ncbi:hypothetical protein [Corynebacterium casei]|uniref:hypothetical protein n=1 Tax=Corynebacterium casei TaxID=160386 RepID=UPI003FD3EA37